MRKLLFALLLVLPFLCEAQIISTFAGGGTSGLGDGGQATAASIADPAGCLFDKHGVFYLISGLGGHRIRKINTSGIISTFAGTGSSGYSGDGGPASACKFNIPVDIAEDTSGNIYVSDLQNHAVRKINIVTNVITTVAGTGSSGFSGDGGPATAAKLYGQNGICFDKYNNLYIGDAQNNVIRKVTPAGIISTFAGIGTYGYSGDGGPATAAQLSLPWFVTADDTGNIYISDRSNLRIRKVNTAGIISTFAGNGSYTYIGDGMPATNAQFAPGYIKMDAQNNLYIGDNNINMRVYKIDNAGIFHTVAGNGGTTFGGDGGPATAATIYYASGLAFDKCNNLHIGDINPKRVRKITYPSTPSVAIAAPSFSAIGSMITLAASVTGGCCNSNTYTWMNKGVVFSTTTTPSISFTKTSGTDSITVKVKGCGDSSVSVVHVIKVNVGVASVQLSGSNIQLYPNPVHTELNIESDEAISAVVISNILGQKVLEQTANTAYVTTNIAFLPAGVYAVTVTNASGRKTVQKLVKEEHQLHIDILWSSFVTRIKRIGVCNASPLVEKRQGVSWQMSYT